MPVRRTAELPLTALVSLTQKENLGEPHAILAGGERYVSPRLAAADSPLGSDVADTVALVQRARVEYYAWVTSGSDSYAVLVAAIGRAAVVLIRTEDRVRIEPADPDRLVESLTDRLPEVPAGRGDSISIRAADYTSPQAGMVLRPALSVRTREARRLDALLRAPRLGGAKLYAARRDHAGTRHRADEWITVLDLTRHGRWAVYATAGRGERCVNAAPGAPHLLAAKLTDLQRSPN